MNSKRQHPEVHLIPEDDNSGAGEQLSQGVHCAHDAVVYGAFISQHLVEVEAVCLKDVLAQVKAVEDGEDAVDAVDGDEGEPDDAVGFDHQRQQQGDDPEGYGDASHVAAEAECFFAEVKEEEDDAGRHGCPDEERVCERRDEEVDILQGSQYGEAVETVDAVDAVHEVPGVEHTYEDDVCCKDDVPWGAEEVKEEEHEGEGCHVTEETGPLAQVAYVVGEADGRDDGHACKEKPVGGWRPEEGRKRCKPEYYPPAAYGLARMRTAIGGGIIDMPTLCKI